MSIYLRKAGGAEDAPPKQIIAISEVWGPWGSDCEFVTNAFQNGVIELSTKFPRINLSKSFDNIDNVSIEVGTSEDPGWSLDEEISAQELERRINWGVLPDDYNDILPCFVRFTADISEAARDGFGGLSPSQGGISARDISRDLKRFVSALDCALQIAKPGCFQLRVGRGYQDLYYSVNSFNSFYYIVPKSIEEIGWPHLRELPSDLVWNWFSSLPGIFRGKSNSPVSKAACIFTRLFRQHFSSDELQSVVWSMSALEALVGEGGRSAIGGLKQKLHLILPGVEQAKVDFEKIIKDIYGLRSGLVHGDLKLASSFTSDGSPVSSSETLSKEELAEVFLGAVLVALLQAAFIRKLTKFEFEYILR